MRKRAKDAIPVAARRFGRPKVRSDDERREIVISKAAERFVDAGFVGTRMDDLASACRMSKKTLYRLFPSKLDLFKEMVAKHRASMIAFPQGLDALPFELALMKVFRVELEPPEDRRLTLFVQRTLSEAQEIPELGALLHQEGSEAAKAQLAEWLAERKLREPIAINDPRNAASMLVDMIFGAVSFEPTRSSYSLDAQDRRAYLRECIGYFVHGVS